VGHLAGGEDGIEQLPELLVLRWVDLQRDQRPDVLQVHRVRVRREDLGMAQDLVDVQLAGEDHTHALDRHDRHGVPQHLEHGLRVGRHFGVHRRERVVVACRRIVHVCSSMA
jgi:hypothetical protein